MNDTPAPIRVAAPEAMQAAAAPDRESNLFGFLRLFFALAVIVSHSPDLIDGNRSREPLTLVFHTLSLGELSVAGFFLISGYLIAKSYQQTPRWPDYLAKRVLRIVPGFTVAFLVSWLVVGPLAGSRIGVDGYVIQFLRLLSLQAPELRGAFPDAPHPFLNGSMFTIAFEFRCYLVMLLIGALGLLDRRAACLGLILLFAVLFLLRPEIAMPSLVQRWVGIPWVNFKFLTIFLCGAAFYLYRDRIRYTPASLAAASIALFALMFVSHDVAQLALASLGGYLLFWLALHLPWRVPALRRVGARTDISYGCYLYAWPVQNLFVQHLPGISPWLLTPLAIALSCALGYLSWIFVEAPCLRLKPGSTARPAPRIAAPVDAGRP